MCVEIWVDIGVPALISIFQIWVDLDLAFYCSWWIGRLIHVVKRRQIILLAPYDATPTLEVYHAVFIRICGEHLGAVEAVEAASWDRHLSIIIMLLVRFLGILVLDLDRRFHFRALFDLFSFRLNDFWELFKFNQARRNSRRLLTHGFPLAHEAVGQTQ